MVTPAPWVFPLGDVMKESDYWKLCEFELNEASKELEECIKKLNEALTNYYEIQVLERQN